MEETLGTGMLILVVCLFCFVAILSLGDTPVSQEFSGISPDGIEVTIWDAGD